MRRDKAPPSASIPKDRRGTCAWRVTPHLPRCRMASFCAPQVGTLPPENNNLMSQGDELKLQRCAAADAEREQGDESGQNRDHAPRQYGGGAGNSSISLDSSQFCARTAGGSLSGLGDFGGVQAEGAADRGESLPVTAAAGAAAQAPATVVTQRRPALLDYCQPMVWRLAWFTPHCETRDGVEVASSGLACLLVVAVTSA